MTQRAMLWSFKLGICWNMEARCIFQMTKMHKISIMKLNQIEDRLET